MQIATLNYQHNPKENFHSDSKSKFQHRRILTTIKNPQKKSKQQLSFLSDLSKNSNEPLPVIKTNNQRPSSIRIKGNGLHSSKLNDTSTSSLHQSARARSRYSDKTNIPGATNQLITPSGAVRSASKVIRVQFGYPVKIRSADFYASDLNESKLHFREESFVIDSVRTANQNIRSSKAPHYEPFDDPNLTEFFQIPVVLDVVRKTLNIDLNERLSEAKKRTKQYNLDEDYRRIVAKPSSGYGKLNGYDCIPSLASAHRGHSRTRDRYQPSANTSLTSFPTYSSMHFQQKKKSHPNNKSKPIDPIATSSPLRHPTAAISDIATASTVSQD